MSSGSIGDLHIEAKPRRTAPRTEKIIDGTIGGTLSQRRVRVNEML